MSQKPDIAQKFKATVLVLILLAPMLVQGLHRHEKEHCCTVDSRVGLNPVSPHNSVKSCLICNFEYVNVLIEESAEKGFYRPVLNFEFSGLHFSPPSLNLFFSPFRAPPPTL